MAVIRVRGKRLTVSGDVGYAGADEFSKACQDFMTGAGSRGGTIDLGLIQELVSICLAAIYDSARRHGPTELTLIVPERLALLFALGEVEGLFSVKPATVGAPKDK